MASDDSGGKVLIVKNWTVVLSLITWTILCVGAFFTVKAQTDENSRRILDLENRPTVTLQQYQDGQEVLKQRLDRIERKLDAQDARH